MYSADCVIRPMFDIYITIIAEQRCFVGVVFCEHALFFVNIFISACQYWSYDNLTRFRVYFLQHAVIIDTIECGSPKNIAFISTSFTMVYNYFGCFLVFLHFWHMDCIIIWCYSFAADIRGIVTDHVLFIQFMYRCYCG